jgi:hypothetical protein
VPVAPQHGRIGGGAGRCTTNETVALTIYRNILILLYFIAQVTRRKTVRKVMALSQKVEGRATRSRRFAS